jgi:hypothetical protein
MKWGITMRLGQQKTGRWTDGKRENKMDSGFWNTCGF